MSLKDNLFSEDVEYDVTQFLKNDQRKRVLVFPPVNSYRRFLIHQLVEERFPQVLHTFSIGQGICRRTVVCYRHDVLRDSAVSEPAEPGNPGSLNMEVQDRRPGRSSSTSSSPEHSRPRQVRGGPTIELYRPPAIRKAKNEPSESNPPSTEPVEAVSTKTNRQRRPDRAVYVPRHRRNAEESEKSPDRTTRADENSRLPSTKKKSTRSLTRERSRLCSSKNTRISTTDSTFNEERSPTAESKEIEKQEEVPSPVTTETDSQIESSVVSPNGLVSSSNETTDSQISESEDTSSSQESPVQGKNDVYVHGETENDPSDVDRSIEETKNDKNNAKSDSFRKDEELNQKNDKERVKNLVSDVLIISDPNEGRNELPEKSEEAKISSLPVIPMAPPEKKVKKVERPKSKPAAPPAPAIKINRDECDWDSLFDDNGDCLDPTLIEEITTAVGEVMIEQPKNDYKAYTKPIEVSSDEFAHVVEIYNFPSDFKTSDLAAVFGPFKNGGFELKWVDDTHCLGVFSSPLIAAEVLASDHPFVKTRPLSEATTLSKSKARRSAEFLQPYRSRPETCAALARRLVTGALGVKLATARQEREQEKIVLREAKERRRLANKQREDMWEGIIAEK